MFHLGNQPDSRVPDKHTSLLPGIKVFFTVPFQNIGGVIFLSDFQKHPSFSQCKYQGGDRAKHLFVKCAFAKYMKAFLRIEESFLVE